MEPQGVSSGVNHTPLGSEEIRERMLRRRRIPMTYVPMPVRDMRSSVFTLAAGTPLERIRLVPPPRQPIDRLHRRAMVRVDRTRRPVRRLGLTGASLGLVGLA
jgi:hypothetical protein